MCVCVCVCVHSIHHVNVQFGQNKMHPSLYMGHSTLLAGTLDIIIVLFKFKQNQARSSSFVIYLKLLALAFPAPSRRLRECFTLHTHLAACHLFGARSHSDASVIWCFTYLGWILLN